MAGPLVQFGHDLSGLMQDRPTNVEVGQTYYATDIGENFFFNGTWWQPQPSPLSERVWLAKRFGERGKPGINGDIQNAAESTRMVTDPDFEVLGTNASSDDVTFNAEGGIKLQTDGADADSVILAPHLDSNQTAWTSWTWGTDKKVYWNFLLTTGANIDDAIIWAGLKLTNTATTATDDDQVFFRYEDDVISGDWQAVSSVGGSDDAHDTNNAVAVSTNYYLEIAIDSARLARFFINNVLVETSAALTDTTDLIPYVGVEADGDAAAKDITVHGTYISRTRG